MDQQSRLNSGSSPYFSNRYYYHQDQDRSSEGERALPRKSRRGTRQSDTNSDYSSFGMNNTDDQLFSALRPQDAVDASEDAAYNSTNTSLSNIGEKNLSEMSDQYRISSPSHVSSRKKSKMSHSSESAPVSMGSRYHSSEHKFRKYVLRRPKYVWQFAFCIVLVNRMKRVMRMTFFFWSTQVTHPCNPMNLRVNERAIILQSEFSPVRSRLLSLQKFKRPTPQNPLVLSLTPFPTPRVALEPCSVNLIQGASKKKTLSIWGPLLHLLPFLNLKCAFLPPLFIPIVRSYSPLCLLLFLQEALQSRHLHPIQQHPLFRPIPPPAPRM